MPDDKQRPPPKDKMVNFRVPLDEFEVGKEKADRRGSTISKVMRALFWMWSHGEGVPPEDSWPPELTEQEIRAEKRPRKKRKSK